MKTRTLFLVGERDPNKRGHAGIEASLGLFGEELTGSSLGYRWVPTSRFETEGVESVMAGASAVWCVPGSPYASTEGALRAIRFAREKQIPFFGTCGGFQHALMEFSESVLKMPALHAEMNPEAQSPLIMKLRCSLVEARARVLACDAEFVELLGSAETIEEFHCSYGLKSGKDEESAFERAGLRFVARDEAGHVRAFKLKEHPFFLGTLFQPERRALQGELHPLVKAFLKAAVGV